MGMGTLYISPCPRGVYENRSRDYGVTVIAFDVPTSFVAVMLTV